MNYFMRTPRKEDIRLAIKIAYERGYTFVSGNMPLEECIVKYEEYWGNYKQNTLIFMMENIKYVQYGNDFNSRSKYEEILLMPKIIPDDIFLM